MIINRNRKFTKSFKKLNRKIQDKFTDKLEIFIENKFDIRLNNHSLNGEYLGFRSINITGNFRAIFKKYPNGKYEKETFQKKHIIYF